MPRQILCYKQADMEEKRTDLKKVNDNVIEIDLLELAQVLMGHIVFIMIGIIVGGAIAYLGSRYLIAPKYTASSKMYMVSSSENSIVDLSTLSMGSSLVADYEELVRIRDIYTAVKDKLGFEYSYAAFQKMFTVTNKSGTRVLKITVESTDPQEAMDIANMIADAASKMLPAKTDTLKPKIVEYAVLPTVKSSPNNMKNGMIGALIGFMIPVGILTLLYITDNSLRSSEDVEKAFGMMPLAIIPEGDIASISDAVEKTNRRKRHKKTKKKT